MPSGDGAGDEAIEIGHIVVIGNDNAALPVNRDAAPVGTAVIAWKFDRAAVGRWRCIYAVIGCLAKLNAADHLIDRRQAPHIAFG